jgi:hypothetical protein
MSIRRIHRQRRLAPRLSFERLEPRLAMAGVVINEFVADNANGIQDEDGDHSDWLELKNTDAAPIDITGWYLTDDSANLTKWQLPATVLDPGEYLTRVRQEPCRRRSGAAHQLQTFQRRRVSRAGDGRRHDGRQLV